MLREMIKCSSLNTYTRIHRQTLQSGWQTEINPYSYITQYLGLPTFKWDLEMSWNGNYTSVPLRKNGNFEGRPLWHHSLIDISPLPKPSPPQAPPQNLEFLNLELKTCAQHATSRKYWPLLIQRSRCLVYKGTMCSNYFWWEFRIAAAAFSYFQRESWHYAWVQ